MNKISNIFFILSLLILSETSLYGQTKKSDRFHAATKYSGLNWDSAIIITKKQLDSIASKCVSLLISKDIFQLTDSEHAGIIRLSNSGFMAALRDTSLFRKETYITFLKLLDEKNYFNTVSRIYPDWLWSRGMGIFIPKLLIEIDGTPHLRSYFIVEDRQEL
jgi:hypothetical protein